MVFIIRDSHEEAQFCDNHSADSVTVHDKCASGGDAGDKGDTHSDF